MSTFQALLEFLTWGKYCISLGIYLIHAYSKFPNWFMLKAWENPYGTYCIAYLSDISKFFKVTTDRNRQDFPHKLHLRLGGREKRERVECEERRVTIVINMHGVETSKAFHISRTDVVACFIHLGQCQVLPNQPKKDQLKPKTNTELEQVRRGKEREGEREKRGREELRVHEWNMRSSGIVSISVSVSISAERRERRRWEKQKQKKKHTRRNSRLRSWRRSWR